MAEGLGRRAFLLGAGGVAGLAAARGLGVRGFGPGAAEPLDFDATLRELAASLTTGQREQILLPWDHPARQVTNTISILDRPHLGTLLSGWQQERVRRLCDAMLSAQGRQAMAPTLAVEGRFEGCTLAVYGEPERGRAQVSLMGGHVHLRGQTRDAAGDPLGGAVAYGHQIGNEQWRIPGNSFAYQGDAANALLASLPPEARARARLAERPHELLLQPRGASASPGLRFGSLTDEARQKAEELVEAVLGIYPAAERERARAALDAHGGLDALHFSTFEDKGFYPDMQSWADVSAEERARRGEPYWQVWRIEGPASVMHFQGHPHVHAYVNIVDDPARAGVGEVLGETAGLEGEAMRQLLEAAMRGATGERLAWHAEAVPGRFCPGPVTTGLAWSMEPYGNRIVVAWLKGAAMGAPLRERLEAFGAVIDPPKRYRVATHDYFVRDEDAFGKPDQVEPSPLMLREALVEHLRRSGVPA